MILLIIFSSGPTTKCYVLPTAAWLLIWRRGLILRKIKFTFSDTYRGISLISWFFTGIHLTVTRFRVFLAIIITYSYTDQIILAFWCQWTEPVVIAVTNFKTFWTAIYWLLFDLEPTLANTNIYYLIMRNDFLNVNLRPQYYI